MEIAGIGSSVVAASIMPGSYRNGNGGVSLSPTSSRSLSSGIVDGVSSGSGYWM